MKHIIITCWTSIINTETVPDLDDMDVDYNPGQVDDVYNSIAENRREVRKKYLWAEIAILKKIADNDDKVHFFFSETQGWKLVKKLFEETTIITDEVEDIQRNNMYFHIITGFDNNSQTFAQSAIPNFFHKLQNIRSKAIGEEVIICPVGWYKSLIPYASLFAMVYGWHIKYLYETSEDILHLPGSALAYYIYVLGTDKQIDLHTMLTNQSHIPLSNVLQLLSFYDIFKNTWKITLTWKRFIDDTIWGNNPSFCRTTQELQYMADFIWINKENLIGISWEWKGSMKKLNDNTIESMFVADVLQELWEKFLSTNNEIEKRFAIIHRYYDKNRILEVYLILRELYIDILSQYVYWSIKQKSDMYKKKINYRSIVENSANIIYDSVCRDVNRIYIDDMKQEDRPISKLEDFKKKLYDFKYKKDVLDGYKKSKDIRNKLAHIWFHQKGESKDIHNAKQYIDNIEKFYKYLMQ
jgi:hypothetical protein